MVVVVLGFFLREIAFSEAGYQRINDLLRFSRFVLITLHFQNWDADKRRFSHFLGSTVFNGMPFFKHKGHDGHKGKTHEIKTLFPLCVLCVLCGKALSR
jgi:hypothetical protein